MKIMWSSLFVLVSCVYGYMGSYDTSQDSGVFSEMDSLLQGDGSTRLLQDQAFGRYARNVPSDRRASRERIRHLQRKNRKNRRQQASAEQQAVDGENNILDQSDRDCRRIARNKDNVENNGSKEQLMDEYIPCPWREERKRLQIEIIKREILQKLKMSQPPNISTSNTTLPMVVLQQALGSDRNESHSDRAVSRVENIYERMVNEDNRQGFAHVPEEDQDNVAKIIYMSQPYKDDIRLQGAYGPIDQSDINFFNLDDDVMHSKVVSANLYLHIKPDNSSTVDNVSVAVYPLKRSYSGDIIVPALPDAHTIITEDVRGKWLKIQLTAVVNEWAKSQENLGLYIVTSVAGQEDSLDVFSPSAEDAQYKSVLDVEIVMTSSRRQSKRAAPRTCPVSDNNSPCCMFPLPVDFDEIGWSWVIEPRRYLTFYCSGNCPQRQNEVQNETRGPCCSPVQMSPISLIYIDERNRVVYKQLRDMVVNGCGCT